MTAVPKGRCDRCGRTVNVKWNGERRNWFYAAHKAVSGAIKWCVFRGDWRVCAEKDLLNCSTPVDIRRDPR